MAGGLVESIFVKIGAGVVTWFVSAALLRGLIKNFRPQNKRNTWTTALIVMSVMSVLGTGFLGVVLQCLCPVVQAVVVAVVYRIGVGLSIGIGILMGLIVLGVALGLGLALGFMWASFGPVGTLVGVVVPISASIAVMIRRYRQEQRMVEAYGSESIRD